MGTRKLFVQSFDNSWGFPVERLFRLPNWDRCNQIHPSLYRSPWTMQKQSYLYVLRVLLLERLKRGDILYIHNRPECAEVLASVAEERGIRVVLHMHNSHLLHPRRGSIMPALKNIPVVFCSEFLRKEVNTAYPGSL